MAFQVVGVQLDEAGQQQVRAKILTAARWSAGGTLVDLLDAAVAAEEGAGRDSVGQHHPGVSEHQFGGHAGHQADGPTVFAPKEDGLDESVESDIELFRERSVRIDLQAGPWKVHVTTLRRPDEFSSTMAEAAREAAAAGGRKGR